MVTSLDIKIRPKAAKQIGRLGTTVTWHSIARGTYNVTNGTATETTTNHSTKVSPPEGPSFKLQGDSRVQAGDKTFMLSPLKADGVTSQDFVPSVDDSVTIGTERYAVKVVEPIMSGDLIAVWQIVVRR